MPSSVKVRGNEKGIENPPGELAASGLGHLLRAAGYETAFAGKQHLPCGLDAQKLGFDYLTLDERDRCAVEGSGFIRKKHSKPWCLVANFINPHDICYMGIKQFAPESDLVRYGDVECRELDEALRMPQGIGEETFFASICPPLPDNHQPQIDEPEAIRTLFHKQFRRMERDLWSEREWRLHRWAYCRLTERVDRKIAVFLDALEASGQAEDTLVVLTSDHGDHDSSHKLEHKDGFYDESARIPLIISWKGKTPARSVNDIAVVSNGLDIVPTLLDYAGSEAPAHCLGVSLRSLSEGKAKTLDRKGVLVENEVGSMLVTLDHKYVEHDTTGEIQLYDLKADPGETRSAHALPEKQSVLAAMRSQLNHERNAHSKVAILARS